MTRSLDMNVDYIPSKINEGRMITNTSARIGQLFSGALTKHYRLSFTIIDQ